MSHTLSSELHNVLQQLGATSSRLEKQALLSSLESNEVAREAFRLCYEPFVNFYLRQIPEPIEGNDPSSLEEAMHNLAPIIRRELTGHAARDHVAALLGSLSEADQNVLSNILSRDMRVGVSYSTINKTWKGLIQEFPVMLAYSDTSGISYPAYSQVKADGMRVAIVVDSNGNVDLFSRNGKPLEVHGAFDSMSKFPGLVFDGELIVVDDQNQILPRKTGNGICSKAIKGTMSVDESRMLRAQLWDSILIDNWKVGVEDSEYSDRLKEVKAVAFPQNVSVIETTVVDDEQEAKTHYASCRKRGLEGTILKNTNHPWVNKRTKNLGKMKEYQEADMRVVNVVEGTGKYVGMVGALLCESSDGKVSVNVGTGFSDVQRSLAFSEYQGKVITVGYNERIKSVGYDIESLFLPRFVEIRHDKDIANSSDEIV